MTPHYSSDQLLELRPTSRSPIAPVVYHRLKDLGICAVRPTHRGQRARTGKQTHKVQQKSGISHLQISLLNTRSVCNKATLLCEHIIDKALDIFVMTETWLKDSDSPEIDDLCPSGYVFMGESRSSTQKTRGGGVGVVYRDSLSGQIVRVPTSSNKTFESMAFKVMSKQSRLIAIIYRPPSSATSAFFEELECLLSKLTADGAELCIVGDFNLHLVSHVTRFSDLMTSVGLKQHISVPTHKGGHTLDFVITRDSDPYFKVQDIVNDNFSDHYSVYFSVDICETQKLKNKVKVRKLRRINVDQFSQDLKEAFSETEGPADVDSLADRYNKTVLSVMDHHAPLCTVTPKVGRRKCWYNDSIHEARKVRRRLERKYRKTSLTVHREMLQMQQKEVVRLVDEAKASHYRDRISEGDTQAVFRTVKGLLQPQTQAPSLTTADTFANYFRDKVDNIRVAIDAAGVDDGRLLPDCPPAQNLLESFPPVLPEEVIRLIKQSPSKSCPLDPMPTWLLKDDSVLQAVALTLTKCINESLSSGTVPTCHKKAIVSPLLKKPGLDENTLKNFRPVSNLAFLGKLMERIVARCISKHMMQNGLYDIYQSAYRKGHSVETALLRVKNDVDTALDEGDGVLVLLTDLSAAFDTVDHSILLDRMSAIIGLRGTALCWIRSYLENRSQCVTMGGKTSEMVALQTGVPQGSVLGPLLFLCYVLPLACVIDQHGLARHGYADDNQTYTRFKLGSPESLQRAIAVLEACVCDIRVWMARNKLCLNDDKTELLLVAPKHHMSTIMVDCDPRLRVGEVEIKPSDCVRNLGAWFDKHMDMTAQVDQMTRSIYHNIRLISRIRHILDTETCKRVVNALVTPRLDFNNALLVGLPDSLIHRLQLAQNAAARVVSRTRKFDHISPVLRALHWLPVRQRIVYKILLLVYKIVNNISPPDYLVSLISPYIPARTLRSSSRTSLLTTPRVRRAIGARAFRSIAPNLWNELQDSLRQAPTLVMFKRSLKTHLFQ